MKIKTYFDTILAIGAIVLLILVVRLQVRILSAQPNDSDQSSRTQNGVESSNRDQGITSANGNQHESIASQIAQAMVNEGHPTPDTEQRTTTVSLDPIPTAIATAATSVTSAGSNTAAAPSAEPTDAEPTASVVEPVLIVDNKSGAVGVQATSHLSDTVNSSEIIEASEAGLPRDNRLVVSADSVVSNAVGNAAGGVLITGDQPTASSVKTKTDETQSSTPPQQNPTLQAEIPDQALSLPPESTTPVEVAPLAAPTEHIKSAFAETTISVPESYNVNARYTTDTESDVLQILPLGSAWPAIGRSIDTAWLQIVLPDGTLAWVFTESIISDQSIEQLPVALAPPLVQN